MRELKFSTFELLRFLLGLVEPFARSREPAVSATWGKENPEQAENKDNKIYLHWGTLETKLWWFSDLRNLKLWQLFWIFTFELSHLELDLPEFVVSAAAWSKGKIDTKYTISLLFHLLKRTYELTKIQYLWASSFSIRLRRVFCWTRRACKIGNLLRDRKLWKGCEN